MLNLYGEGDLVQSGRHVAYGWVNSGFYNQLKPYTNVMGLLLDLSNFWQK